MRVCLIGGLGFIGQNLKKVFVDIGWTVVILDIRATEPDVYCDVRDYKTFIDLNIGSVDWVINLAAAHSDDLAATDYYTTNVEGAKSVCKFCDQIGAKKLMFFSSMAVYGDNDKLMNENFSHLASSHYGKSKSIAEDICENWFREDDNRLLITLRPSVVFGVGNQGNFFNLLKQIEKKRFVVMGNGQNIKSVAYVENLASFTIFSINLSNNLRSSITFNYCDMPNYSFAEIVEICSKELFPDQQTRVPRIPLKLGILLGHLFEVCSNIFFQDSQISVQRIKKAAQSSALDSSRAHAEFVQPFTLEEGIAKTVKSL